MKVAHLSTVHGVSDGRIVGKEARSLSAAGWEVVVILAHTTSEMLDDIRVIGVRRRERRLARITGAAFETMRVALREKADVYHFHDPELIPVGLCLRALGKKVVYDVHETNWATVAYKSYLPTWSRPALAWLIRNIELTASKYFSGIVAATPKIAEQFMDIETPCVTIQNFPKLTSKECERPFGRRGRIAIYAGVITEGRGLLEMVDAVNLLPESFGASLVLAGPIAPDALAKARTRPGWSRVVARGAFQAAELPQLLSKARVGLVVLQPMNNYKESYPTKMFEYMAAGLPVIASDFPLWRSILSEQDCGLLVDPSEPAAIASAMEYLLRNEEVAEQMGQRGREVALRRYNWETEERKLTAFYERFRLS